LNPLPTFELLSGEPILLLRETVRYDHIATVEETHQTSTEAFEATKAILFDLELLDIANLTIFRQALEECLEFGSILGL
jgi:hypothetical protein